MNINNITSNYDLELFLSMLGIHVIIKSKDNIELLRNGGNYIINLADHNKPGTHWVALFIKQNIAIYFDSYGLPPPTIIKQFYKGRKLIYNADMIQSMNSTACGYYCILFLHHFTHLNKDYKTIRQFGYALNKFNQPFDLNNTQKNDLILRDRIKNIYI
jgi:hypothetical protein